MDIVTIKGKDMFVGNFSLLEEGLIKRYDISKLEDDSIRNNNGQISQIKESEIVFIGDEEATGFSLGLLNDKLRFIYSFCNANGIVSNQSIAAIVYAGQSDTLVLYGVSGPIDLVIK